MCGESFSTEKKLAKHRGRMHSSTEIKCDGCNSTFKNKKSLGVHKAKKVCPAMVGKGAGESRNKNSKDHEKENDQSERKTYKCKLCPKVYLSDRGLRYHKQGHMLVSTLSGKQEDKAVDKLCDIIVDSTNTIGVEGIDYYVVDPDEVNCITFV